MHRRRSINITCLLAATRRALVTASTAILMLGLPLAAAAAESDYSRETAEVQAERTLRSLGFFNSDAAQSAQNLAQAAAGQATELIMRAMSLLGVRYKRGGSTEDSGLDCSGLVKLVFGDALGMKLPHRAEEISRIGEKVQKEELKPGDLVFYNTLRRTFSHVGIYLGEGRFIHAPASGGKVRVENMDLPYWTKRFNGARRVQAEQQ